MLKKLKYNIQAFQKDQFWFPPALIALFIFIIYLLSDTQKYGTAKGVLGFVLPLITGALAAYAYLEDKILELRFSFKQPSWQILLERQVIILLIITAISLLYQLFIKWMGISLEPLGSWINIQLIWFIPCLTISVFAGTISLLAKNSNIGFAVVGGIWIFQFIARAWFAHHKVLRNVLLFYGIMDPLSKEKIINQITLITITLICLITTTFLIKKQERYI